MNLQRGMSLEAYKARREQFRKISCDHIFICRHLKHMLHAVLLLDAYVYSSNMRDEELARTEVELMMLLGGAVTERQIRVARKELIEAGFLVLVRRGPRGEFIVRIDLDQIIEASRGYVANWFVDPKLRPRTSRPRGRHAPRITDSVKFEGISEPLKTEPIFPPVLIQNLVKADAPSLLKKEELQLKEELASRQAKFEHEIQETIGDLELDGHTIDPHTVRNLARARTQ